MGEIAEDMIDGTCCSLCGCYFENPKDKNSTYTHGIPVICWECWDDLTKGQRKMYIKAEVKTF
jgi:hypothetical protein